VEDNAAISNYLKRVGVRRYPSPQSFRKYLERQHGTELISELLDVVSRRGEGEEVDVYPLLYSSLELSIDFLGFEGDLHANFLQWLLRQYADLPVPPTRILDLGSGNGVLSCFYATHFPNSEVVGLDRSSEGIACAEELKRRLNLTNVQFVRSDFIESGLSDVTEDFELITAAKCIGTAIDLPEFDEGKPLFRASEEFSDFARPQLLSDVVGRLAPDGVFVTMDRWAGIQSFCWWVSSLNDAGVCIDFDCSGRVEYRLVIDNQLERIPVLWNRRSKSQTDQLRDAIGFWLHANYTENWAKLKTFDFQHDLAEMAFASVNPKTFCVGIKSEHAAGGIFWREIWKAGPFLLVYQFTNNGIRRLEVLPSIFVEDAEKHLREQAAKDPQGTSVSTYGSPQFKWE
jgi:tRNA G46 methylase TrmB